MSPNKKNWLRLQKNIDLPVLFSLSEPARSTKWNFAVSVSYCSGASVSPSLSPTSWSGANRLCLMSRVKTACERDDDEFILVAAVVRASAPARRAPKASLTPRTARIDAPTTLTPPQPSSVIRRPPYKQKKTMKFPRQMWLKIPNRDCIVQRPALVIEISIPVLPLLM